MRELELLPPLVLKKRRAPRPRVAVAGVILFVLLRLICLIVFARLLPSGLVSEDVRCNVTLTWGLTKFSKLFKVRVGGTLFELTSVSAALDPKWL